MRKRFLFIRNEFSVLGYFIFLPFSRVSVLISSETYSRNTTFKLTQLRIKQFSHSHFFLYSEVRRLRAMFLKRFTSTAQEILFVDIQRISYFIRNLK